MLVPFPWKYLSASKEILPLYLTQVKLQILRVSNNQLSPARTMQTKRTRLVSFIIMRSRAGFGPSVFIFNRLGTRDYLTTKSQWSADDLRVEAKNHSKGWSLWCHNVELVGNPIDV